MYIPTITSWLHSQWHKNIATKIALWVWPSQQFSSRCRTSNKNNTEYRTSVQKITLLHQNKENSEKKQTQKQFFHSNRSHSLWHSSLLKPKIWNNKFSLILDIFCLQNWCFPDCKHCIVTVFWLQNNHSNRSLTKV
jgi:hypothetical protein